MPRRKAAACAILGRALAMTVALTFTCGLGPSRVAHAGEPLVIPDTFAEVAATALAASFVVRASGADVAAEGFSVPTAIDSDDGVLEDRGEPGDAAAALRDRTVGAGVIIDPRGIAVTSARAILRPRTFEVVLMDGTPVQASLVALDRRTDVAVLRSSARSTASPFTAPRTSSRSPAR